jgi:DNA processing protein
MDLREYRLIIAAHHEAGAPRIAEEIRQFGIERVVEGIPINLRIDPLQVSEELEKSGAKFLIPEDIDWPSQLNDLAVPPVGIFVKGNIEALAVQSLAIVGTRNPTPYGIRAAQEFAAGFVDREWATIVTQLAAITTRLAAVGMISSKTLCLFTTIFFLLCSKIQTDASL